MSIIPVKTALNCALKKKIQLHKMSSFKNNGNIFEEMRIDISYFFLSILMNLQKVIKPCHSEHSEKSLIYYFTNITKISDFCEAINFLLVCFLHSLRERKFEIVESIKLHSTWSESGSKEFDKIRTDF